MARRRKDRETKELFVKEDKQLTLVDKSVEQELLESRQVECLGKTFPSDEARREYYLELLAEKLKDPEFRATPGFPKADDEDILRLSDPPYYTACPNPFLEEFVRHHGKEFDPDEEYHREPFAVDVSEGKTDQLYRAHGYHTKVPHLAIVPSILHYTKPGDLVLDGFAGSGMTGVAAQWCGTAPEEYKKTLEAHWREVGHVAPEWGARRAILGDLGPAATFIAANYNIPFDVEEFAEAAQRILDEVEDELGWMYETRHTDGAMGRINYTVWSEVFSCPECTGEIVFLTEALDRATGKVAKEIECPHCSARRTKRDLELLFESRLDPISGAPTAYPRRVPLLINYSVGGDVHEKVPDRDDLELITRASAFTYPSEAPSDALPDCQMTRVGRVATTRTTHVHHFFLPRAIQALAELWRRGAALEDRRLRNILLFFLEQAIWGMSVLNRYSPSHFSQVNRALNGVYYVGSQHSEVSPWYILNGKLKRLSKAFRRPISTSDHAIMTTGDCAGIGLPADTIDYIFTDPPFGENIYYADLNFLVEAWHHVLTDSEPEAIVDKAKKKSTVDYQDLMRKCFEEYYRVLKPGRWMTLVFSNSKNAIWRAIQEGLGTAGFVVADVRSLDKKQGSFRQVTSSAVKQDLVISSYKPSARLQGTFELGQASAQGVWTFITEHLSNVPVFVRRGDNVDPVVERTPQRLLDRMIAFHVQRGMAVPMDSKEFLKGLGERYSERDGMYFLPDQVAEYDRKRARAEKLRQLELFVSDEASAIQWVRQQLAEKPRSFQDLQPQFMKELQAWAKHEQTVELQDILEQNFLLYQGDGPVPSQIHSYLSTQYKTLRGLEKDDRFLVAKAKDRWYVPDPGKAGDLEKLRERTLLREFETYKASKKKLKQFRTEAVRVGFKAAYDANDYDTIVSVAEKIPDKVLQEDEKLLMYYDVAVMRRA